MRNSKKYREVHLGAKHSGEPLNVSTAQNVGRKSCRTCAERTTLLGGSYEETDLTQCKNLLMSYREKSVKGVNNYLNKEQTIVFQG